MHLGAYAEYKKQNVEVFVEHDDEELPFGVLCTPITMIRYNPPFKKPSPSMPAQPKTDSPKPPQIKGCQPKNVLPKADPPKSSPSNAAEAIRAPPNTAPMKKALSQHVSAPKKVTPSKRPATQPLRRSNRLIWSNRKNLEQSQVVAVQKIQANAGDNAELVEEATQVPATGEREVEGQ
ncbi:uncharacterized protein LOC130743026 [Lotus japonicus]|uniref:uncharacterized protein LOC130743026 n=1 Tax=Lotus japonicus TaxID=34305 RepID=UPI002582AABC|nr:uncharacterized protein LOC130743026 [Lotus japonicus]